VFTCHSFSGSLPRGDGAAGRFFSFQAFRDRSAPITKKDNMAQILERGENSDDLDFSDLRCPSCDGRDVTIERRPKPGAWFKCGKAVCTHCRIRFPINDDAPLDGFDTPEPSAARTIARWLHRVTRYIPR